MMDAEGVGEHLGEIGTAVSIEVCAEPASVSSDALMISARRPRMFATSSRSPLKSPTTQCLVAHAWARSFTGSGSALTTSYFLAHQPPIACSSALVPVALVLARSSVSVRTLPSRALYFLPLAQLPDFVASS